MKGECDAEYPIFVPFKDDTPQPKPGRVRKGDANFEIDEGDWDNLPTLHHVISRLEEIPISEVVSGKVVEGTGVTDVGAAYRVEETYTFGLWFWHCLSFRQNLGNSIITTPN